MPARPVLILDCEPRVTVTIARSLHRRLIPVDVAVLSARRPSVPCRAIRHVFRLPDYLREPAKFIDDLCRIIEDTGHDMLIAGSDFALDAVGRHDARLRNLLHVNCPPRHVVEYVLDKRKTLDAARECGIAIPASHTISGIEELEQLRRELTFPVIFKQASKEGSLRVPVRSFDNFEQLRGAFTENIGVCTQSVLQEFCFGVGVGIETLIVDGKPLVLFQHRRLKEMPRSGGVSVLAISETVNEELAESAVRLLRHIGWSGVAMVEFRWHPVTKQAILMEVNGRFWGSLALLEFAGIDLPFFDWQIAHGQRPAVSHGYSTGTRMRWTTGDFVRLLRIVLTDMDKISPRDRAKEVLAFFTDFLHGTRDALWSFEDPLPAIMEFLYTMKAIVTKRLKSALPSGLLRRARTYRRIPAPARLAYLGSESVRALGWRPDRQPGADRIRSTLFVCCGNIIRSPMAAALLQRAVGYDSGIEIESAGLHVTAGESADERAKRAARQFGVSLDRHSAQPLTEEKVKSADAIFVMDRSNEATLLALWPDVRGKTFMLGAVSEHPTVDAEIDDPYEGDDADVRRCYERIEARIECLAQHLRKSDECARVNAINTAEASPYSTTATATAQVQTRPAAGGGLTARGEAGR